MHASSYACSSSTVASRSSTARLISREMNDCHAHSSSSGALFNWTVHDRINPWLNNAVHTAMEYASNPTHVHPPLKGGGGGPDDRIARRRRRGRRGAAARSGTKVIYPREANFTESTRWKLDGARFEETNSPPPDSSTYLDTIWNSISPSVSLCERDILKATSPSRTMSFVPVRDEERKNETRFVATVFYRSIFKQKKISFSARRVRAGVRNEACLRQLRYKAFSLARRAPSAVHGWHNNFITLIVPIYSTYTVCRCLRHAVSPF